MSQLGVLYEWLWESTVRNLDVVDKTYVSAQIVTGLTPDDPGREIG